MHLIDFGWGTATDPTGGAYPQTPKLDLREREGRTGEGRGPHRFWHAASLTLLEKDVPASLLVSSPITGGLWKS